MGWEHVIPQFILRLHELATDSDVVRFPIQGTGEQTRSFVFIDDFIDGLMALIREGQHLGTYNIGTREEVTIAHLARMVGELFGKHIEIVPGPIAPGGTTRRCPDIAKIAALGYAPKISLREGLAITTNWYRDNLRLAPAAKSGN
jgi:nucleoside-diphosphate-sugar epimerase